MFVYFIFETIPNRSYFMSIRSIIEAKRQNKDAIVDAGELSTLIEAHLDIVSGGGYSRTTTGHSKSDQFADSL